MSIVLLGSTSGSCTLQEQAVAGTTTLTLPTTSGTVLTTASTDTANSLNAGLGVNQTWQSVTRNASTTYTNSTGKPIMFMMSFAVGAGGNENVTLTIGGVSLNFIYGVLVSGVVFGQNTAIIPNGSTYSYTNTAGVSKSIYELR
jgi:hypothetical protein